MEVCLKYMDKVPEPTLRRLPWYLSNAKLMREKGEIYVSSTQISKQINIDASQVAKDLSYVKIAGRTRVGYEIDTLIDVLEDFLGFTRMHKAFLFGVGNLGGALLQDSGLGQFGLEIVGAFDVYPMLVGTEVNGIPIYHTDDFEQIMDSCEVNIGVLTVPINIAQEITDRMVTGGIKAVWNFTPFRIRVPEDIIVTGFEATQESLLNDVTITSFESNAAQTAADAVDMIRRQLEPDKEIVPYTIGEQGHIHHAMSCGCKSDATNLTKAFRDSFYNIYPDYEKEDFYVNADIGQLMEAYVGEKLSGSTTPEECLKNIYMLTYMNKPYKNFYLCLRDNWLNTDDVIEKGYPEQMKIVVHTAQEINTGFYRNEDAVRFDTRLMIPQMFEETDEPSVFFFSAVHFMEKTYGYEE